MNRTGCPHKQSGCLGKYSRYPDTRGTPSWPARRVCAAPPSASKRFQEARRHTLLPSPGGTPSCPREEKTQGFYSLKTVGFLLDFYPT